jgi:hypothetical protein
MNAELVFTLLCDDVRVEASNKLTFVGIYNYVIAFPTPPDGAIPPGDGPMRYPLAKLFIVRRWKLARSPIQLKTRILGPDRQTVFSFDTQPSMRPEDAFCNEIIQLMGLQFVEGVHQIVTTYQDGGEKEVIEPFEVRVVPAIASLQNTVSVAPGG